MSDKVKVVIRLRPLNRRELDLSTKVVVDTSDNQTVLYHPNGISSKDGGGEGGRKKPKIFAFDHCFWSMDERDPKFSGQEKVFSCLGVDVLERAFEGYNACIFAYGQTGSGKSFTMMGTHEQKGLIPRLCDTLFERIALTESESDEVSCKVEVSYMEIYNEKVHDLLDFKGGKQHLRVREHNILGPYVDGLSLLVVERYEDIDNLMSEGNKSRTVAATNMNNESSRSHAVFNIILTQTLTDKASAVTGEKVSKLSLVDLAGSERAVKTGAVGERLKEGSNINKSLTTLGLVISALADQGSSSANKNNKQRFVPYRDSVLTWLLKDNLGGNSKTVMVATLSPAADNYEETLSTLRYADRAKRIVNHAVVNEDPNARIIRELREEVEVLKVQLDKAQSKQTEELEDRLEETQKLFRDMTKTWEEKLAETERIHTQRHHALEKMGISVQTSGIKVQQDKCFLVNLNADPSLNELLVYYLKPDLTQVGRPDAPNQQDIQLSGLGILPEHCVLESAGNDVYLTPFEGARTCVNGSLVKEKTRVKHGDRILWGNNHFFRLNCPKANSPVTNEVPSQTRDYDFAQQEVMKNEMPDDPIQEAISAMEKQQEDDKQEALDKQRQMYERQMQMLRSQLLSPSTPSNPFLPPFDFKTSPGSKMHNKYQQWAKEREKLFRQSLVKLKEEVVKANSLVRGANILAQEMGKKTDFSVTLQIPAGNLSPNRKRGAFVSEPAILVKRKDRGCSQVWSMEKFENKIIDMREMYEERKEKNLPMLDDGPPQKGDPFYESQENHNLIGVANVFLECLFHDVTLDYHVPIISQQGEVSGRLHIQVNRIAGCLPDRSADAGCENVLDSRSNFDYMDDEGMSVGNHIVCEIAIEEAKGLPPALANFVFCKYSFWGHPDSMVVPPVVDPNVKIITKGAHFCFDHKKEFKVYVTEEFIEHAADGALSIEVWGHRNTGCGHNKGLELETVEAKSRSILDRWAELIRKLELWVEIHELNDQGDYMPVEVVPKPNVLSGGTFQLRQGHSRRIIVYVNPVQNSGTLPIICETITSLSVGCVGARSKLQKGLDSYQEEDLNKLREKWSEALTRRRQYLDEQLKKIMDKSEKNDADNERERSLIDQWVCLTEERNAVLVPQTGSIIPGAPAEWTPPGGMEQHIPVIFLDLNADDMTTPNAKEGSQAAGTNSILPKEHGAKFFNLPILRYCEKEVCAVASWDSSIHDSINLNRITPNQERVYMILKAVVRLSHPASMELVLRKRLCLNIYKKQSLTDKLKKRMSRVDQIVACGVTYDIVSNIPKASEDLEDRESLAQMAASAQHDEQPLDGETYIEKYIKGVSAVESILTLDKLRQEVAVKELLAAQGRPLRKTASVPNIHGMIWSDSFSHGLEEQIRSESVADLSRTPDSMGRSRETVNEAGASQFTHASQLNSLVSPQNAGAKFVKPMRTLLEEQHVRETKPLLKQEDSDSGDDFSDLAKRLRHDECAEHRQCATNEDDEEFQAFEFYKPENDHINTPVSHPVLENLAQSNPNKSLLENHGRVTKSSPYLITLGYESESVSTLTLSSENSKKATSDYELSRPLIVSRSEKESSVSMNAIDTDCVTMIEQKVLTKSDALSFIDVDVPIASLAPPPQQMTPHGSEEMWSDKVDGQDDTQIAVEERRPVSEFLELGFTDNSRCMKKCTSEQKLGTEPVNQFGSEQNLFKLENEGAVYESHDMNDINDINESVNSNKQSEPRRISSQSIEKPLAAANAVVRRSSVKLQEPDHRDSITLDHRLMQQRNARKHKSVPENKLEKMVQMMSILPPKAAGVHCSRDSLSVLTAKEDLSGSYDGDLNSSGLSVMRMDHGVICRREVESPDGYHSDGDDSISVCSFGSRADLDRLHTAPIPPWIQVGEPCLVSSSTIPGAPYKVGWVRFVGSTEFAAGQWVGVECDMAEGKNDGSVRGVRYFKCRSRHGLFVRHDKLTIDKKRRRVSQTRTTHKSDAKQSSSFPAVPSLDSLKKKH